MMRRRTEIVHDEDIGWLENERELLFGISAEAFAVDQSVENTTSETIAAQSAKKRQNPQATVQRKAIYSVVLRSLGRTWSDVGLDLDLVDEDQAPGSRLICHDTRSAASSREIGAALLNGEHRFELQPFVPQGHPNCIVRDMNRGLSELIFQPVDFRCCVRMIGILMNARWGSNTGRRCRPSRHRNSAATSSTLRTLKYRTAPPPSGSSKRQPRLRPYAHPDYWKGVLIRHSQSQPTS